MTALHQFLQAYQTMREAQRDYANNRTQGRLDRSKALEHRLDAKAAQLLKELGAAPERETKQETLL